MSSGITPAETEMNGNIINDTIFCNFCKGTCVLRLLSSYSIWTRGSGYDGSEIRFSLRSLAFSPNKNVNIHNLSGTEAHGLRGLWKLSALITHLLKGPQPHRALGLLAVFVRVKKSKYSQAVVLPLWSHRQLLHCGSGLQ